jgi:predicted ATPase
MAALEGLIRDGHRLITLTGPGGAGKTRLALELLHRGNPDLDGRSYFCDLSEASTIDDVCRVVAAALGVTVRPTSRRSAVEEVGRRLTTTGRLVLCLDNFEQIVSIAEPTVAVWLRSAPELTVIVTSRERLRLGGERAFDVPPLEAESHGVELLYDRARAAGTALVDTEEALRRAVTLCERLDGLPLAIELAAGRLGILRVEDLLDRWPHDMDLWVTRVRDGAPRHRSLHATLDASWALLSPVERRALALCSVFSGPFDARDAQAVLSPLEGTTDSPAPVLDLLERLRDQSLIVDVPAGPGGPEVPRFRLYQAVRQYAALRLVESGEHAAAGARHAEVTLRRCREASALLCDEPGLHRRNHGLAALARCTDDVVRAHRWALAEGGLDARALGAEALLALMPWFRARGPVEAHADRLTEALAEPLPSVLEQRLRRALAELCRAGGDLEGARRSIEAGLASARAAGDSEDQARFWCEAGELAWARGDMVQARAAAEAALALLDGHRDGPEYPSALTQLARVHQSDGRPDLSRPLLERALDSFRVLGDRYAEGRLLATLGFIEQDLGHLEAAERQYRAALQIHQRYDYRSAEAIARGYLGNIARRRGDIDSAARRYGEAIELLEREGWLTFQGVFLMDWGIALSAHGDYPAAEAMFSRALERLADAGQQRCRGLVLGHLGAIAAMTDRIDEAERRWSAAERELASLGSGLFSRAVATLRGLGEVARLRDSAATSAELDARIRRLRGLLADPEPGDHMHFARLLLERALERAAPPADALVVEERGAWFRAPGGEHAAMLSHRPLLSRVLCALCASQAREPGAILPTESLFRAAWQGERASIAARDNRVRVAVCSLRKLGLAVHFDRRQGGYRLHGRVVWHAADQRLSAQRSA